MLHNYLIPKQIKNKIRFGVPKDGGYVLSLEHIYAKKLISCGCDNQTSFEEDFLRYNPNSHIDIYDINDKCDLAQTNNCVNFYNRKVIDLNELNISEECIIQMDIEGDEYNILNEYTGNFKNIKQFVVEFHLFWKDDISIWKNIFEKLNRYFYLIHIHGNNCETISRYPPVPDVIECTYLNKNYIDYIPEKETSTYPLQNLDFPNCISNPDLTLNWWNT